MWGSQPGRNQGKLLLLLLNYYSIIIITQCVHFHVNLITLVFTYKCIQIKYPSTKKLNILFSLIFTSYLYTVPPGQDTYYLLKPNLLWVNTLILFFVSYYFSKISKNLEKKETLKIKRDLIIVGVLSYLFLFYLIA